LLISFYKLVPCGERMRNYVLVSVSNYRGAEVIIAASTNKKLIFRKAAKLARQEVKSKSWEHHDYYVNLTDNRTGEEVDTLEFVCDRREKTFGKIVRDRGCREERIVGSWI